MASWQNGKLTKWQVDKVASWQNVKFTKCQVDKMFGHHDFLFFFVVDVAIDVLAATSLGPIQ
jgi:hypothetical protein